MNKVVRICCLCLFVLVAISRVSCKILKKPETNAAKVNTLPLLPPTVKPHAKTMKDFNCAFRAWWRKLIVDPYKQSHPGKLNDLSAQIKFLDEYCSYKAQLPLEESIDSLIAKGRLFVIKNPNADGAPKYSCDPLLTLCLGDLMIRKCSKNRKAEFKNIEPLFIYAMKGLEKRKANKVLLALAADRLSEIQYFVYGNWGAPYEKAIEAFAGLFIVDNFSTPEEQRIAYHLLYKSFWLHGRSAAEKMLRAIKKSKKNPPPWLVNMIKGRVAEKKAWEARGGGWASTVTKEGWKKFKKFDTEAAVFYRKAWKLYPELPEAAERLISVAMAGHTRPGEGEEFWFQKALNAEIDDKEAYRRYLWALRPRWGGSHAQMLGLGLRAYNTKRFDTPLPLYFVRACLNVTEELPVVKRLSFFRQPQIKKMIIDIYEKILAEKSLTKRERWKMSLEYACCKAWMGDYVAAKKMYDAAPKDISLENLFFGEAKHMIRWRKQFEKELHVFTGKDSAKCVKWENAILNQETERADALLKKLLDPQKSSDIQLRQYILDRSISYKYNKSSSNSSILYEMIDSKRRNVALYMIQAGADVNEIGPSGWSPLHIAIKKDYSKIIMALLKAGANVDERAPYAWTPLHFAARYSSSVDTVRALLEKGADIEALTNVNDTPLTLSIYNEHNCCDILKLLIKRSANINARESNGKTAAHLAAEKGKTEMLKILLKAGADANAVNEVGWTPLHLAARYADIETTQLLLDGGANCNLLTNKKYSPLNLAVFNKKNGDKIAKLLIKHGAKLDNRINNGSTALFSAVEQKNIKLAKILLKAGADIELRNRRYKRTPLHKAAFDGSAEMVRLLLKYGADVNVRDTILATPLGLAIYNPGKQSRIDIVTILLADKKTDLNLADRDNQTPLFWAAREGKPELVRLLLSAGADKTIKDKSGRTPLDITRNKDVRKMLSEKTPDLKK